MSKGDPIPLSSAEHLADKYIIEHDLTEVTVCGSIRRQCVRVHDIDLLVVDPDRHGEIDNDEIAGTPVQIYYTSEARHGAALLFLTGDKDFNIRLRHKAQVRGLKLNRYGLWNGEDLLASKTEESIMELLLDEYVPPEGRGQPSVTGVKVEGSKGDVYEVFVRASHGFNFCSCKGFRYRGRCRHLSEAVV